MLLLLDAALHQVSEPSERALMKTRILSMKIPRKATDGFIHY